MNKVSAPPPTIPEIIVAIVMLLGALASIVALALMVYGR